MKLTWLVVVLSCLLGGGVPSHSQGYVYDIDSRFTPVSVTPIDKGRFVVADYKRTYIIERFAPTTWTLKVLPIEAPGGVEPQNLAWTNGYFNPTGVEFDTATNSLFIANYVGKNILRAEIEGSPPIAVVKGQITHPELKSPENVSVRGDRIAVADYDASMIFMFDRAGTLLWRYPLSLAHGVVIGEDAVYAAGLGTEKLVKISLTGEALAKGGADLLYPTQIALDGPNLAVIDANAGAVVAFDKDLTRLSSKGENGPGSGQYHRPYGIAITPNYEVIADTSKNRVVIRNAGTGDVHAILGQMMPTIFGDSSEYGKKPTPYCSKQVAPEAVMALLNSAYKIPPEVAGRLGYQTICLFVGDAVYTSALTPFSTTVAARYRPSIPLGFTWQHTFQHQGREVITWGAPDNRHIQIFDPTGPFFLSAIVPPGIQLWSVDRSVMPLVEGLVTTVLNDFAARAGKCESNAFAAYLDTVLVTTEKTANLPADRILDLMLFWAGKEAVIEAWKTGGNLDGAFSDWIAKGRPVVIEDAMWLALMSAHPFAETERALLACRR